MRGETLARYIAIKDKAVGLIPGFRWALTSDTPTTGDTLRYDGTAWVIGPRVLTNTTTWNPGSVGADAYTTQTITVTGVEDDDDISCVHSAITGSAETGWLMHGHYASTDTVRCVLFNGSGTSRTVGSGTLRATVWKF